MDRHTVAQKRHAMPWMKALSPLILSAALSFMFNSHAQSADLATLQKLPLLSLSDLQYAGGFRLPTATYGVSDVTYSQGPIALGPGGQSLFVVGHAHQQAIGEFKIPALVNTLNVSSMNTAAVIQGFSQVLNRPASGNRQALDTIGGMAYVNGRLLVNGYQYYDASGAVSDTTLVVTDASRLSTSVVGGYHKLPGNAHASGWISPIPADWQSVLGGTYITGHSSGVPIISRLSVGPSAFAFDPSTPDIGVLAPATLKSTTLMDFSLSKPMGVGAANVEDYLYNVSLNNTLWNHLSLAAYGFIVPGTRTYLAIGSTGGLTSGIGYKITQDNGNLCGGYCSRKVADNYNYYWLFDLNDLVKVKAGQLSPSAVMPYAHGKLDKAYANNGFNAVIGGAYDSAKGLLYLSLQGGDRMAYGWAPLIVAFKLNVPTAPDTSSPPAAPGSLTVSVQ